MVRATEPPMLATVLGAVVTDAMDRRMQFAYAPLIPAS